MHLSYSQIRSLDRIKRINLIKSVSNIKSASLIGSISEDNEPNLTIFNSILNVGFESAALGLVIHLNNSKTKNTYKNIISNGSFTLNHVNRTFVRNAQFAASQMQNYLCEFKACNLTEQYEESIRAPFVLESDFKLGLMLTEETYIPTNNSVVLTGEIIHAEIPDFVLPNIRINTRKERIKAVKAHSELMFAY